MGPRTSGSSSDRLESLDQFRGYTVAGMLLVNFLGGFAVCPGILRHHHDYFSYADSIMPQFLFAVGFAFRLTFGRRVEAQGGPRASARVVRRLLGLVLIALVVYEPSVAVKTWDHLVEGGFWEAIQVSLKRTWFQTLMHIAVTSLWILPVIQARPAVRVLWMFGSAAAHVVLSDWFNFAWVNISPHGIDGGPLGFLTWTIPAIVGTLACDAVLAAEKRPFAAKLFGGACLLMALGYLVSCGTRLYDVPPSRIAGPTSPKLAEDPVLPSIDRVSGHLNRGGLLALAAEPPFVPPPDRDRREWNYWMMSQRSGTLSYLIFGAGFSLAVFVAFHLACDRHGWRLGLFRTFGSNALLAYVLHGLVGEAIEPFVPKDSPLWYVLIALTAFFAVNWVIVRHFEVRGQYLRV